MVKIKFCVFILILLSISSQAASIDDTIIMCNDCHGKNGVSSNSNVPSIAGFSETTISDMLTAYIDETRIARNSKFKHGDTSRAETNMTTISKKLTESDIGALSTYYAKQTPIPAPQKFDIALAKKGKKLHKNHCIKCHEDGGSSPDDDSGILAGQWIPFLKEAFQDYRSGKRETDAEMQKKINKLSEKQVKSLIHYYASQQ